MKANRVFVALGGNAIKKANETGTYEEQLRNCDLTTRQLARIIRRLHASDRVIITHGNGPQVGNLMVQQDAGRKDVPPQQMDVVGAMTQGQIGYMLQQSLENNLKDEGVNIPVLAVVNQVLVDMNDPEFSKDKASKPVGNFLTEEDVSVLKKEHPDFIFKKVKPSGERVWRRTVASPDPIRNVESDVIRKLVDSGVVVIASGGGGVPVTLDRNGHLRGTEAVIDKDLAGEKLAEAVDATTLLILTDVERVMLNYGRHDERTLEQMSASEAKRYLEEGQFMEGSMAPKVNACVRFLDWGGSVAIIASLEKALEALEGKAGTAIYPDSRRT